MKYNIREIEAKDNKIVEKIIRDCLIEFGANHEGTAWTDPNLGRFSEIYGTEGNKYWVAEDENGKLVGGVGIGELEGTENICELQKMYCIPEVRGKGIAHELLTKALEYAPKHYEKCYLETLDNMVAAQKFYEKHGFKRIYEPVVKTGHFACDVLYIKDLKEKKMNIGIIAAEEEEMLAIKTLMKNIKEEKIYNLTFSIGELNNCTCILVKSGVGKVNAARTTQKLIDTYSVDYVINIGSAGGIREDLNIKDVVIANKLVQYDFDVSTVGNYEKGEICEIGKYIESDKRLVNFCEEAIKDIKNKDFTSKVGVIASADMFCSNLNKAKEVKAEFNAECVEMEGAAVAQVCFLDNVPFLVIKCISDTPNGNNGIDFHKYLKEASKQVAKILEKMLEKL